MRWYQEKCYPTVITETRVLAAAALAAELLRQRGPRPLRVLCMGCGPGGTVLSVAQRLQELGVAGAGSLELYGWDISSEAVQQACQKGVRAEVQDVTEPGLAAKYGQRFDLILFMEVLEHLVDTGAAIRNVRDLLAEDGFVVLTTPNLAAWYNRILLLAGNQPHMTEVAFEPVRFGNRIFERLLKEKPGRTGVLAGHLRVFTRKALREFLDYNGFEIRREVGIATHGDILSRLVARWWVGGAGDVGVLLTKKAGGKAPQCAVCGGTTSVSSVCEK